MTSEPAVQHGPAAAAMGRIATVVGRQRELSLVLVMAILAAIVAVQAPQFTSASNLKQVAVLAAIFAIASVGEALVILTRNVDLSVESTIGLVAFVVANLLRIHALSAPEAMAFGIGLGLVLGMINGAIITVLRVPAIVATLGTLSIYRGVDFLLAGGHQVSVGDLPAGYTDAATATILGIPLFVWIALIVVVISGVVLRQTRFGRQVYAVGSNPDAAAVAGLRSGLVVFAVFSLCGLLAGIAGVLWGIEFGTINATAANGAVLQVIAAVVVGGVAIFGGSGSVVGAALGAVFLGFISNALILLNLSQFWLEAIYGAVILAAVAADAVILRSLQAALAEQRSRR
jgi:rhamnose transport system permease protein